MPRRGKRGYYRRGCIWNSCSADGVIPTIGKHVIAENTLAGGNEGVGVDEAGDFGVVISGLQVIEPGILGGGLVMLPYP